MTINPASIGAICASRNQGVSGPADTYFGYVVALLLFDDQANGSTVFTNSASHGSTFAGSGFGAAISTTSPQSGAGCFDCPQSGGISKLQSTSNDYLYDGAGHGVTAGDWTIECSYYMTAQADTYMFDIGDTAPLSHLRFDPNYYGAGRAAWEIPQVGTTASNATATTVLNAWNSIALSRIGTSVYQHFDGVLVASYSIGTTTMPDGGNIITLGTSDTGGFPCTCKLDNFRYTVGVGRYGGSNYTPSFPFATH